MVDSALANCIEVLRPAMMSIFRAKPSLSVSLASGEILLRPEAATQGNCFDAKSAPFSVTAAPQRVLPVSLRARLIL